MTATPREPTLLTGTSVWTEIRAAMGDAGPRRAAIAYLGADAAALLSGFGPGDMVVCNAGADALRGGATSPEALDGLLLRRVSVLSSSELHAKVVVFPDSAFVGSANASASAAGKLVEAVVRVEDPKLVQAVFDFVDGIGGTTRVDEAYVDWARTQYWPPRPRGGGGGPGRPPVATSLYVASYVHSDTWPAAVDEVVRRTRRRMRAEAGPAAVYELDMSWDADPSWVREGDWVLWVNVSRKPQEVWPPMKCIGRQAARGRSPQIVTWFRLLASADNQPWDDVRGRVLARTGKRLSLDRRARSAEAATEVFDLWGIDPNT